MPHVRHRLSVEVPWKSFRKLHSTHNCCCICMCVCVCTATASASTTHSFRFASATCWQLLSLSSHSATFPTPHPRRCANAMKNVSPVYVYVCVYVFLWLRCHFAALCLPLPPCFLFFCVFCCVWRILFHWRNRSLQAVVFFFFVAISFCSHFTWLWCSTCATASSVMQPTCFAIVLLWFSLALICIHAPFSAAKSIGSTCICQRVCHFPRNCLTHICIYAHTISLSVVATWLSMWLLLLHV